MTEAKKLADATFGLWLIPFTPPMVAVGAAWATGWAVPVVLAALFLWGWPYVWFRWLTGGDDVPNR